MSVRRAVVVLWLATLASACDRGASPSPSGSVYRAIVAIPLPGDGDWDHITSWSQGRTLFVAHQSHLDVVDLDRHAVVRELPDLPEVHGVVVAPELERLYTSNGGDSSITVLDARTLHPTGTIKLSTDAPDGITYDPVTRRVFAMAGSAPAMMVVDAGPDTVVATVPLGGDPDGGVPDGHGSLYVTLKHTSEIVTVDASTLAVKQRWSLGPCEHPDALALDAERQRLVVGCDNRTGIIVSTTDGHLVASAPIGKGVDGALVQPDGSALFVCGDGTLVVVRRDPQHDRYQVLPAIHTERGARTAALDEATGTLYLATGRFTSAERDDPTGRRSAPIPGSFHLTVMAPAP